MIFFDGFRFKQAWHSSLNLTKDTRGRPDKPWQLWNIREKIDLTEEEMRVLIDMIEVFKLKGHLEHQN